MRDLALELALERRARHAGKPSRRRIGRRMAGWALIAPWVLLPLLPAIGFGLSHWLGLGLL